MVPYTITWNFNAELQFDRAGCYDVVTFEVRHYRHLPFLRKGILKFPTSLLPQSFKQWNDLVIQYFYNMIQNYFSRSKRFHYEIHINDQQHLPCLRLWSTFLEDIASHFQIHNNRCVLCLSCKACSSAKRLLSVWKFEAAPSNEGVQDLKEAAVAPLNKDGFAWSNWVPWRSRNLGRKSEVRLKNIIFRM